MITPQDPRSVALLTAPPIQDTLFPKMDLIDLLNLLRTARYFRERLERGASRRFEQLKISAIKIPGCQYPEEIIQYAFRNQLGSLRLPLSDEYERYLPSLVTLESLHCLELCTENLPLIGTMTRLRRLSILTLYDHDPNPHIASLTNLRSLRLETHSRLLEKLTCLNRLPLLEELSVPIHGLYLKIEGQVTHMTTLRHLSVPFKGTPLTPILYRLTRLETIDAPLPPFSDESCTIYANFPNLRKLEGTFDDTLTRLGIRSLTSSTSLTELVVNEFMRFPPGSSRSFRALTSLRTLKLYAGNYPCLRHIANHPTLHTLSIDTWGDINPSYFKSIATIKSLRHLEIDCYELFSQHLSPISRMTQLVSLSLTANDVPKKSLLCLSTLQQLEFFGFRYRGGGGDPGTRVVRKFTRLKCLSLIGNRGRNRATMSSLSRHTELLALRTSFNRSHNRLRSLTALTKLELLDLQVPESAPFCNRDSRELSAHTRLQILRVSKWDHKPLEIELFSSTKVIYSCNKYSLIIDRSKLKKTTYLRYDPFDCFKPD